MQIERKIISLFDKQSKEQKSIPGLVEVARVRGFYCFKVIKSLQNFFQQVSLTSPCPEVIGYLDCSCVFSLVLAIDFTGSLSDVENHQEFAYIN